MLDNNGPKDGDFVKYVEALGQAHQSRPASEMADMSVPNPHRSDIDALLDKLKDSNSQPGKLNHHSNNSTEHAPIVSPDPAMKKSLAKLIRALVLAFVALFIAAPMLSEPFDAIVRLAAIFYVVYTFKNMRPVLASLRTKLTDINKPPR